MDLNPSWGFTLNLRGVAPATGGVSLPPGYYRGIVKESGSTVTSKGTVQIGFRVEITEPAEYAGVVRTAFINVPTETSKGGLRNFWRGALESVGYTSVEIEAGDVNFGPGLFNGRVAHVVYDKTEQGDNLNFLPPEEWAKRMQAAAGQAPAAPSAGGGLGIGASAAPAMGMPTATADLLARARQGLAAAPAAGLGVGAPAAGGLGGGGGLGAA